jgi:aerobic carbon-monoxide dehydrogenase medium subunit
MSSVAFKPKYYLVPKNQDELETYLREYGDRAKIIAGGTGIYEVAHRGLMPELEALIDVSKLGLSYVKETDNSIVIGAGTTMSTLLRTPEVLRRKELAGIVDALKAIQPTQVKNVATIAGAICTALPFFDLPVALLSLGARVRIAPTERLLDLEDFIRGYFAVDLANGEFVREIEIPLRGTKTASAFQKFAVTHDDWALVNCGSTVSMDKEWVLSECTIVFGGGIGEKPVRATNLELALKNVRIDDESKIKKIFEREVPTDIEPVSDIRSSAEYRMQLAAVIGRRTFTQASERL